MSGTIGGMGIITRTIITTSTNGWLVEKYIGTVSRRYC